MSAATRLHLVLLSDERCLGPVHRRLAEADGRLVGIGGPDRIGARAVVELVAVGTVRRRLEADLAVRRVRAEEHQVHPVVAGRLHPVAHRLRPVLVVTHREHGQTTAEAAIVINATTPARTSAVR
jgi:hypothetical protein